MGKPNLSPTQYRKCKYIKEWSRELPDLPETAFPRYQVKKALTHRRGEKRMARWLGYV